MAGKFELKAIISAVDKLSPALKSINRTAKLTVKALKDVGTAGQKLAASIGIPITLASAATVEALRRMIDGFADYGSKIHDTATKTGLAAKELQELAYAAKLEGVEFETLTGGTIKLNKAIAGAASGKNKEAAALFKKLGVNLRDSKGHLRDAGELMPEVADGLNRIKNPAQRTAATLALFGKSGAELYPFLALGSKGMKEAAEEARALGLVLSDKDLKNADELGDNFDRIKAASQGLSNTIGAQLAPVLNPLIQKLIEWYKSQREIIGQKISGAIIKLARAIEQIDWNKAIDGLVSFGKTLSWLAESVGGWSNLVIGFFALANAHIILAIFEIVGALFTLNKVLLLSAANMLKLVGVQVFTALGNFVVAIRAGYTAMQAFNLVLLANPIGLIIAAVAALAAAAYLIYRNWDKIAPFFSALWEGIKAGLANLWETIKTVFSFTPLGMVIKNWEPIKEWFSNLVDSISGFFDSIPEAFQNAIEKVKALMPDLSGITNSVKSAWRSVTGSEPDAPAASNDNAPLAPAQQEGFRAAPVQQQSLMRSGALNSNATAAQPIKGEIAVKFENAPKGLRVQPAQNSQRNVAINTDVGYSSNALGMPA